MEGTPEQREHVKNVAAKWLSYINLRFEYIESLEDSDVRIAFMSGKGSWSYLGKQNRSIAKTDPTMNFGWLSEKPEEDERGTILHEYGHMLGLGHEHQNPNSVINWKRDLVIAELSGPPNNWSVESIERNVLSKYGVAETVATKQDFASIMMYSFPSTWNEQNYMVYATTSLSRTDKLAISQMYPKDDWTIDYESDVSGDVEPPTTGNCCTPIIRRTATAIAQYIRRNNNNQPPTK